MIESRRKMSPTTVIILLSIVGQISAFVNIAPVPSLIARQYKNDNDLMTSLDSAVVSNDWFKTPVAPPVTQQELMQRAARNERLQGTATSRPTGVVAHETSITSLDHLRSVVTSDTEQQRYTVVKFYASWCKTCARFGLKFDKLVSKYGDWVERQPTTTPNVAPKIYRDGAIRFASVDYSKNQDVFESLGIKQLPTIHIYDYEGNLVADFACPPSAFSTVTDKVKELIAERELNSKKPVVKQVEVSVKNHQMKQPNTITIPPTNDSIEFDASTAAAVQLSYRSRSFSVETNHNGYTDVNPYIEQEGNNNKRRWWRRLRVPLFGRRL